MFMNALQEIMSQRHYIHLHIKDTFVLFKNICQAGILTQFFNNIMLLMNELLNFI